MDSAPEAVAPPRIVACARAGRVPALDDRRPDTVPTRVPRARLACARTLDVEHGDMMTVVAYARVSASRRAMRRRARVHAAARAGQNLDGKPRYDRAPVCVYIARNTHTVRMGRPNVVENATRTTSRVYAYVYNTSYKPSMMQRVCGVRDN